MKLMLNGKEVSGMGHYVMAGDIKDATTETSHVLSGKDFYNNNGKQTGTMPNRGGVNATLGAGESYPIPDGYHNGEGVVKAQDLASQTTGDAEAGDIASGKTAYVNGNKLTGSLVVPAVNDWDPYEMEENVMVDLANYTYKTQGWNKSVSGAGTYIINAIGGGSGDFTIDGNGVRIGMADGEFIKLTCSSRLTTPNSGLSVAVWKKN